MRALVVLRIWWLVETTRITRVLPITPGKGKKRGIVCSMCNFLVCILYNVSKVLPGQKYVQYKRKAWTTPDSALPYPTNIKNKRKKYHLGSRPKCTHCTGAQQHNMHMDEDPGAEEKKGLIKRESTLPGIAPTFYTTKRVSMCTQRPQHTCSDTHMEEVASAAKKRHQASSGRKMEHE